MSRCRCGRSRCAITASASARSCCAAMSPRLRHQEQELITKDATIREIHHRVKNNLQTVASLLRIQARRTHSEEAREALTQAMRRVAAIAVVHDTLSEGLAQTVDFDEVFDRVLRLVAEVAAAPNTRAKTSSSGTLRHAAERVRDSARAGAHGARHQRRRARARRARGPGRDRRRALRREPGGARSRHGRRAARGSGRARPRHPDRAHPDPGRARAGPSTGTRSSAAARRSRSTSRCAGSTARRSRRVRRRGGRVRRGA